MRTIWDRYLVVFHTSSVLTEKAGDTSLAMYLVGAMLYILFITFILYC